MIGGLQALLSILDSPLNKAGKVRAVYMKTERGVLIEVKPHVRLPRTYKRFAGIMSMFHSYYHTIKGSHIVIALTFDV